MKGETGRHFEDKAVQYLAGKGYRILDRNYRSRWGEIDIICMDGPQLVFVEVRSKSGMRFGEPEESMTPAKIERIRKTAFAYLEAHRSERYRGFRFDFIGVRADGDKVKINHVVGAF